MNYRLNKKIAGILLMAALLLALLAGCGNNGKKMDIRLLIVPHFEIGEMTGDAVGEAQLFYEKYMADAETYKLACGKSVYYNSKNKTAMCITGSGKTNCAIILTSLFNDARFNLSDAYVLAVGCSGGAKDAVTLGDVCIAEAICDYDLGHTADPRDLVVEGNEQLWYHDPSYDDIAFKKMNTELVNKAYELVKDTPLETTEIAKSTMYANFGEADWATREPMVITGVNITSDNYWKGEYNHDKANAMVDYYYPEGTYTMTEMEDIAIADAADSFGLLGRSIFLRVNVNPDVFINGASPESLWSDEFSFNTAVEEENQETLDIFEPAMRNLFKVGSEIADAILAGNLK